MENDVGDVNILSKRSDAPPSASTVTMSRFLLF